MTDPATLGLSIVQRDALVRAHRAGHRYPAFGESMAEYGITEQRPEGWRLTDAGVAVAAKIAEGETS